MAAVEGVPDYVERKGSLFLRSNHMNYSRATLNSNWFVTFAKQFHCHSSEILHSEGSLFHRGFNTHTAGMLFFFFL